MPFYGANKAKTPCITFDNNVFSVFINNKKVEEVDFKEKELMFLDVETIREHLYEKWVARVMTKRYCTLPAIPWFRNWFEKKFHYECATHDSAYTHGKCKLCADYDFSTAIAGKGYPLLSIAAFLAVNMPWVWWSWYKMKRKNR